MGNKSALDRLEKLDHHFVEIYEDARTRILNQQKSKALIVVYDDVLILYEGGNPAQEFPGLLPPTYLKMKTLGHMPLAIYSMLHDRAGTPLDEDAKTSVSSYLSAIKESASELDTSDEVARGILPRPNNIYKNCVALLKTVSARGSITQEELATFTRNVCEDIIPVLAAAARAQLDACQERIAHIRRDILSEDQWNDLRVLVLGPYMARRGEIFLQYFSQILHTPMQGDRRLVYYDGDDLKAAFDRLGTTMLDALASKAIFADAGRLHRDVLADETTHYLKELASHHTTKKEQGV